MKKIIIFLIIILSISPTYAAYDVKSSCSQISDNFVNGDNWTAKTYTGADAEPWVFNNFTAKPNPLNINHLLWNKNKIQDGAIKLTLDNPIVNSENIYASILFRGKDYQNYYQVSFTTSGSQANNVFVFKAIDGVYTTVQRIYLTTPDVQFFNGKPCSLEVSFVGTQLKITINGKIVSNTQITAEFNSGLFGIGVRQTNAGLNLSNTNLLFSNLTARELKYDSYSNDFKKILIAGDSIGAQAGSTLGNGWISIFASTMYSISADSTVFNISKGGFNTSEVYDRLYDELTANPSKYDMVIVSCGTNDTRSDYRGLTYEQSINDLIKIIKLIKDHNAIPIICTPPNFADDNYIVNPLYYDENSYSKLARLASGMRLISITENIKLVDNYSILNNDWTKLNTDRVHPNDSGHALMADNLFDVIFNTNIE